MNTVAGAQEAQEREPAAVSSKIFGIVALIGLIFPPLLLLGTPLFAIIFGHIAKGRIKRSQGTLGGEKEAKFGLIAGYTSFFLAPFVIVGLAFGAMALGFSALLGLGGDSLANTHDEVNDMGFVGTACIEYAHTNEGKFPSPDGAEGLMLIIGHDPSIADRVQPIDGSPLSDQNAAMIYFGADISTIDHPKTPLLFSRPSGGSVTVYFLDTTSTSIVTGPISCVDVIDSLHTIHEYPDELYQKLISKAEALDGKLSP
jgi:hypothetical protein